MFESNKWGLVAIILSFCFAALICTIAYGYKQEKSSARVIECLYGLDQQACLEKMN